ncbi:MAG: hypothetical protein AAF950_07155 [Pseudomonadota bacterium]
MPEPPASMNMLTSLLAEYRLMCKELGKRHPDCRKERTRIESIAKLLGIDEITCIF